MFNVNNLYENICVFNFYCLTEQQNLLPPKLLQITVCWLKPGGGHPSHIMSRSSGSDPVYKMSRSDLDSALDHMH